MPAASSAQVLQQELPGLSIGNVRLSNGEDVLGVLGEPILCEGQRRLPVTAGDEPTQPKNRS